MRTLLRSCHFYSFLACAMWAASYITTKEVVVFFDASTLSFLRCLVGALTMSVFLVAGGHGAPRRADVPKLILAGALGLSVYFILFNQGTSMVTPTTSCIIISTAPIITAVFANFLYRERLSRLGWLSILFAFGGILIIMLWEGTVSVNTGVFWVQGAAFLMSGYNLLQRKLSQSYQSVPLTAYIYIAAALTLAFLLPRGLEQAMAAPFGAIMAVVYLGVFPGALAYLAWIKALSIAPKTSYVTNYMFLTPFLAMVLEYAVLVQMPDTGVILGGSVILGSLLLFTLAGKKRQ